MTTMLAARIHNYGGSAQLRIEEAPVPKPDLGEVLLRVVAAGVNPVDWKTCRGQGAARFFRNVFPFTPGWDVTGEVVALGAGVTNFKQGDQAFGYIRFPQPGGTHAEYVAAPAHQLVPLPQALGHVQAAALAAVALTAWQTLFDAARLQPGQRVLVHGAAGGVGHIAVQLARWRGAEVIGTASSDNLPFLHELGVAEAIDYREQPVEERVRDLDVVLDTIGGATRAQSWGLLRRGGVLVSTRSEEFGPEPGAQGVAARFIWARPDAAQLARIVELVKEGHVQVAVNRVFPLQAAAEAFAYGEGAGPRRGKIVLEVGAP